jgi:hypothetical protein
MFTRSNTINQTFRAWSGPEVALERLVGRQALEDQNGHPAYGATIQS